MKNNDSHIYAMALQRRIYAAARRQREGTIAMNVRIMEPTPEEMQGMYADFMYLIGEFEEAI